MKKKTLFGSLTPSKLSMQYWDVTQLLAFLSSLYDVWGLLPDTVNTSSHAYNPKT